MNVPKKRPMDSVPKRCTKKTAAMTASVTGTTGRPGLTPSSPSIALVTVMAGVITPSASKVLAPMTAAAEAHFFLCRRSSA